MVVRVEFTIAWHTGLGQAEFDRDAALNEVPDELVGINSGLAKTTSLGAVPAVALQDGHDFNSWQIGIGVAAFVDRAGRTNWDKNLGASSEYPGAVDGGPSVGQ